MRLFLVFALSAAGAAWGQTASALLTKAPPDVDEALRARVMEFYHLQMEGKFRQGEKFVCEASKDAYYDGDKRKWSSATIQRIDYNETFQEAKVTTALGTELTSRGTRMPVMFPFTGQWKMEAGNWCHSIPPPGTGGAPSPFGFMKGKEGDPGQRPTVAPVNPAIFTAAVRISQTTVNLSASQPSNAEVTLENTLPGSVSIRFLAPDVAGLVVTLTKSELGAGEKGTFLMTFQPGATKPPAVVHLAARAEPVGQVIPIKITFTP